MAVDTRTDVSKLVHATDQELWRETRRTITSGWSSFKRCCQLLAMLKERYLSQGKGLTRFYADVKREVGYCGAYVCMMVRVAHDRALTYMEDSVAAHIDVSAALLLSSKKTVEHPRYVRTLAAVKKRAVRGEQVTYSFVRHSLYPSENRVVRAVAESELGRLVYTPKQDWTSLAEVKRDVLALLETIEMRARGTKKSKKVGKRRSYHA